MEKQPTYTRCLKCNRPLKNKEAQERGYGSYCWIVHQTEINRKRRTLFDIIPLNKK